MLLIVSIGSHREMICCIGFAILNNTICPPKYAFDAFVFVFLLWLYHRLLVIAVIHLSILTTGPISVKQP